MAFDKIVKQAPPYLYKYRAINEFIKPIFQENKLYFSAPSAFNDPFDSKIYLLLDATEEDKRKYAEKVSKNNYPNLKQERREEILNKGISLTERDMDSVVGEWGICSLAEYKEDLLMWAHYADGHGGICLGFSVRDNDFFSRAMSVKYKSIYPHINLYTATDDDQINVLLTKSQHWSYEKEWRIIELEGKGEYKYPSESLKEVILGCQITEENRKNIINLINEREFKPVLYQAVKKEKEFGLDFEKLDI